MVRVKALRLLQDGRQCPNDGFGRKICLFNGSAHDSTLDRWHSRNETECYCGYLIVTPPHPLSKKKGKEKL